MTGTTHRQYSICFSYIAIIILTKLGVYEINYYIALVLILMSGRYGAIFPDLDHKWQYVKTKTMLTKIINVALHITGGKHRSWQTHSIDVCMAVGVACYLLPDALYKEGLITNTSKEVLLLILMGFISGWMSHLLSDMLTIQGVRVLCVIDKKIHLVPRKIWRISFTTGSGWEEFNYKILRVVNAVLGVIVVIYPWMMYRGLCL